MNTTFSIFFTYVITFLLFSALLWKSKNAGGLRLVDTTGIVSNPAMLLVLHGTGILLFGIVPLITRNDPTPPVFQLSGTGAISTLVSVTAAIGICIFSIQIAGKHYRENQSANLNLPIPGVAYLLIYFIFRLAFIAAYETWFRGYLLTDCIKATGVGWAIFINVFLYTLMHFVNDKKEIIACIPFGII